MESSSERPLPSDPLGRGWVSPSTNCFTQNVLTVMDIIERLGTGKRLPPEYLPFFFHEITHHWCFQSTVGSALRLLRERTYLLLLASDITKQEQAQRIFQETLFKYEGSRQLLLPWIEGIAQFAEFDASLGESEAYSSAAEAIAWLFLVPDPSLPRLAKSVAEMWRRTLAEYRVSNDNIARKKLLLESPFVGTGRGVYLRGYLLVKNLYHRARRNTARFADTDLFVAFLRHVIFSDSELAEILLDSRDELECMNAAARRLQSRIGLFEDPNLDSKISDFETQICKRPFSYQAISESINVDRQSWDRFHALVEQWHQPPRDVGLEPSYEAGWQTRLNDVIVLRSLIRLAIQSGEVSVGPDGNVWLTTGQHKQSLGPKIPGVSEGKGPGAVGLYYVSPNFAEIGGPHPSLAMVVLRNDELVRGITPAITERETSEVVLEVLRFGIVAEEYYSDFEFRLQGAEDWFHGMPELMAKVRTFEEKFSSDIVFSGVPRAKRDALRDSMARTGLYELLDRKRGAIEVLAAIGAYSAAGRPITSLSQALVARNIDFDAALRLIVESQNKSGLQLIGTDPSNGSAELQALV